MGTTAETKNQKSPGICIFCGRHAGAMDPDTQRIVSMSKQHLFPRWMQKEFPKSSSKNSQAKTKIRTENSEEELIERQGDIKSRQLRIICKSHCNNGWISRVESESACCLLPLMKGENIVLSSEQQALLALWICLEMIIWEFTDPRSICVPLANRMFVYQYREPPKGWNIWIGQNKGKIWEWRYRHFSYTFGLPQSINGNLILPTSCNFQITSFQIGQLFVHGSSSTHPEANAMEAAYKHRALHRLWPITGKKISWPLNTLLNDRVASEIADRMNRKAVTRR